MVSLEEAVVQPVAVAGTAGEEVRYAAAEAGQREALVAELKVVAHIDMDHSPRLPRRLGNP